MGILCCLIHLPKYFGVVQCYLAMVEMYFAARRNSISEKTHVVPLSSTPNSGITKLCRLRFLLGKPHLQPRPHLLHLLLFWAPFPEHTAPCLQHCHPAVPFSDFLLRFISNATHPFLCPFHRNQLFLHLCSHCTCHAAMTANGPAAFSLFTPWPWSQGRVCLSIVPCKVSTPEAFVE